MPLIQRVPEQIAAGHRETAHPDRDPRKLGYLAVYLIGLPGAVDSYLACRRCANPDDQHLIRLLDAHERSQEHHT